MPVDANVSCSTSSVPNIVATGDALSQTSALITTLWTAPSAGLYRVSIYYYKSSGSGSISGGVTARDPNSNLNTLAGVGNFFGGDMVVKLGASATLDANISVDSGSPTFNFYYTVEQLQ